MAEVGPTDTVVLARRAVQAIPEVQADQEIREAQVDQAALAHRAVLAAADQAHTAARAHADGASVNRPCPSLVLRIAVIRLAPRIHYPPGKMM